MGQGKDRGLSSVDVYRHCGCPADCTSTGNADSRPGHHWQLPLARVLSVLMPGKVLAHNYVYNIGNHPESIRLDRDCCLLPAQRSHLYYRLLSKEEIN